MFQDNYNDDETFPTPLPLLVSKFSKISENSRKSSEKETEENVEATNLPKFMNLNFQNIFLKDKHSIEQKEKIVVFSKLNLRNLEENKEKPSEIQPFNSEIYYLNKATSTAESINKNNYFHNKTLSQSNVPASAKPTILKKDQFKTTIQYYKYLIEKNESNRRLNTNFMVKDHFLKFSKKMKNNNEINVPNLDQLKDLKNIQQNQTQINKVKSKSTIPNLNINYMQLNKHNSSNKVKITEKRLTNVKAKDSIIKQAFNIKIENENKSNNGIFKEKLKKIFTLKNKKFKLKFIEAEINSTDQF